MTVLTLILIVLSSSLLSLSIIVVGAFVKRVLSKNGCTLASGAPVVKVYVKIKLVN